MQYILSEAEYNELVSAKQAAVSDITATQKSLDIATKRVLELTQALTDVSGELRYYKGEYRRLLDVLSTKEREILRLSRKSAINEFGEVVR